MLFKKIIALIACASMLFSFSTTVFASNLEEISEKLSQIEKAEKEQKNADAAAVEGQAYGENTSLLRPFNTPSDYLYNLFGEIVNLYVDQHLYSFTREELINQFFRDLIDEHPEYYKLLLNTLLGTMDKYSSYHSVSSGYLEVENNISYGIITDIIEEGVLITDVIANSPAERAGLAKGDVITDVSGISMEGLAWNAVSSLLKRPYVFFGQKNEAGRHENYNPEVYFTVKRNGATLVFPIMKDVVFENELSYSYLEKEGVAYIAIESFLDDKTVNDFKNKLSEITSSGIKKLIIDLRDNGGGSLDYAVDMAENFVENGDVMCYFNSRKLDSPEPVISTTPKFSFDSISVLINEDTASAAELMADILKMKAGAVLVGKTSVGKAIGQSVYNLTTGDYITITTYEMLDVNMQSYNEIGLIPDLEIDNVELLYDFPKLEYFNHENYKTIEDGVWNEACLALERRLNMMDLLYDSKVDGIWDDSTKTAVFIMQKLSSLPGDGYLNDETVTYITDIINTYKDYTYYEDSQFDVALLYHSSFDQAKRLIAEKKLLAKQSARQIEENRKALEEFYLNDN